MLTKSIAWGSKELVNQYNYYSSGHFFDADTMRFFKSRVTDNYRRLSDTEAVFITTERGPSDIRKATIRRAKLVEYVRESDGRQCLKVEIDTVGEFNGMTLAKAKRELEKL
jgi:hypothetical protein